MQVETQLVKLQTSGVSAKVGPTLISAAVPPGIWSMLLV